MTRFNKDDIVQINHPGTPVHGQEAVVLTFEERNNHVVYFLEVAGDDCAWVLPETSLLPTGRTRECVPTGALFSEAATLVARPKRESKLLFDGARVTVIGSIRQGDDWWYTLETEAGVIIVLREDELEPGL